MGAAALSACRLIGLHDVTHRKNQSSKNGGANGAENGHSGAPLRANGHASESAAHDGLATHMDRAASDDMSGLLVAGAAASAASCANRDTYAEMAQAEGEGKRLRPPGAASRPSRSNGTEPDDSKGEKKIPPGIEPLPLDGRDFVEAVHKRVDLIALEEHLLRCTDDKIVQRELAYLRELMYGKVASVPVDDEIPRIVFEVPADMPDPGGNE